MSAVMWLLSAIVGLAVLIGATIVTAAVKAIVEKEYDGWAPLLSELFVRVACRLWPARGEEFAGELAAIRNAEETGVVFAFSALLGSVPHAVSGLRAWRPARRVQKQHVVIEGGYVNTRIMVTRIMVDGAAAADGPIRRPLNEDA